MKRVWNHIGGAVVRRPFVVLGSALVLVALLALGLPNLHFTTSEDTIISKSSQAFKDNQQYQQRFGGEAMFIMYSGDVSTMFTPANVQQFERIATALDETGLFQSVVTPLTAMQFAQDQLQVAPQMLLGARARASDPAALDAQMTSELTRLGAAGDQSLSNPAFTDFLLREANGDVRPAMIDNFPDPGHAIAVIRVTGNASIDRLGEASDAVKRIADQYPIAGATVMATGAPTLLQNINDYLQGGMATLGLLAVAVMAVILWFVFRARWRLLSLVVVAIGAVWAFGGLGLTGIALTMVTISGLPILIGLGVDFAIQMHNRFEEEIERGYGRAEAVRRSMRYMARPLVITMVAAIAGFLALQISPIPMLRDFGVMLTIGAVALVLAAVVLTSVFLFFRERKPTPPERRGLKGHFVEGAVRRVTSLGTRWAVPLVVVALIVAGLGLAYERHNPIETDPEGWVDQNSTVIHELDTLRAVNGASSELGILVSAPDVNADAVVEWMNRFANAEVQKHPDELLHVTSMPELARSVTGVAPTGADVQAVLSVAPTDVKNTFVDSNATHANIIFPVAPMIDRKALLDGVEADLAGSLKPPAGVTATPSGLLAVGVELIKGLDTGRGTMTYLALGAVAVWLALAFAGVRKALLPLVPVVAAVGVTSLVVAALGITLTPLTTVANPLVIAVSTEFAVLLMVRYIEERRRGKTPEGAVADGSVHIGRAFVASGLTLLGGFAVLSFSALPLLRDFGIVVAVSILAALVSALVLLPPLLRWADDHSRISGFRPGRAEPELLDVDVEELVLAPEAGEARPAAHHERGAA